MRVYETDLSGVFIGATEADPDPLVSGRYLIPARAVMEPPPDVPDGFLARWTGEKWITEPIPAPPAEAVVAPKRREAKKMRLDFQSQDFYLNWAAMICGTKEWPVESVAVGVINPAGETEAVIVYNAFYDRSCAMHIATMGRKTWATRNILGGIFAFAFYVAKVYRINAILPKHNILGQIMALKLGFVFEGNLRAGASDGSDAILMSMLAPECRWIKDEEDADG